MILGRLYIFSGSSVAIVCCLLVSGVGAEEIYTTEPTDAGARLYLYDPSAVPIKGNWSVNNPEDVGVQAYGMDSKLGEPHVRAVPIETYSEIIGPYRNKITERLLKLLPKRLKEISGSLIAAVAEDGKIVRAEFINDNTEDPSIIELQRSTLQKLTSISFKPLPADCNKQVLPIYIALGKGVHDDL